MTRRSDIDAAKGLAILLVVFGHLVARADPANVFWYEPLRRAVYAFHMPFFLYLSGLLAASPRLALAPRSAWGRVAASRAQRLLVPFFGLGAFIVLGKILLRPVLFVDNPPVSLFSGLADLVWHTADSPALTIWYLFVLYVVSLAAMAVLNGQASRWPWLLGAALALSALPAPAYLYADRVTEFAPFFVLGLGAGLAGARWEAALDHYWRPALTLFLMGCALIVVFGAGWSNRVELLLLGPLSMLALHGILRHFRPLSRSGFLPWLGRYSFVIYLGNTIFIGLAKGVLLRFVPWDGPHFSAFAVALMSAGLLGPIAFKRTVLCRVRGLDRLTE